MEWDSSDAIVLTAIANSGRSDLRSVIATADACNHDVMPEDCFASAVGRLVGSGLVGEGPNGYRCHANTGVKSPANASSSGAGPLVPDAAKVAG